MSKIEIIHAVAVSTDMAFIFYKFDFVVKKIIVVGD